MVLCIDQCIVIKKICLASLTRIKSINLSSSYFQRCKKKEKNQVNDIGYRFMLDDNKNTKRIKKKNWFKNLLKNWFSFIMKAKLG